MLESIYESKHLKAWLLDHHLVTAKFPNPELYLWNTTAAALWLSTLDGAKTLDEITQEISSVFSRPQESIREELSCCLNEWVDRKWMILDKNNCYQISSNVENTLTITEEIQIPKNITLIDDQSYCIDQQTFRIKVSTTPACHYQPFLNRLNALVSGFRKLYENDSPHQLHLILGEEATYLSENQSSYSKWPNPADALSQCIQFFLRVSSNYSHQFITMHAAGIGKESALILSGISGAGKSTLCALLANLGWDYFGDDIIGLHVDDRSVGHIIPFPSGVSIKENNWDHLAQSYPQLRTLDTITYGDKVAKFLPLPKSSTKSNYNKIVSAIIFPTYSKNRETSRTPLTAVQALTHFVQAGISLDKDMGSHEIECFLRFLSKHPIYQLTYSDITEVNTWLSTLAES